MGLPLTRRRANAAAGNLAHKMLYGGLADLRPMPSTLIDHGPLRSVSFYRPGSDDPGAGNPGAADPAAGGARDRDTFLGDVDAGKHRPKTGRRRMESCGVMEEQSAADVLTVAGLLIACAGWYLRTKAVQRKKGQVRFAIVSQEVAFGIFVAGLAAMLAGVAMH